MKLSFFVSNRLLRHVIQRRMWRMIVAEIEAVDSRRVLWTDRRLKARTLLLWRRDG